MSAPDSCFKLRSPGRCSPRTNESLHLIVLGCLKDLDIQVASRDEHSLKHVFAHVLHARVFLGAPLRGRHSPLKLLSGHPSKARFYAGTRFHSQTHPCARSSSGNISGLSRIIAASST